MKLNRFCPKCNSTDIFIAKGKSLNQYDRFNLTTFKFITFDRHICINCGYIEEWVADEKHLEALDKMKSRSNDDFTDFV